EFEDRRNKLVNDIVRILEKVSLTADIYTGVNMADAINNILSDFNIKDNTLALTTDNEFAMIICGRLIAQELQHEFDNIGFSHYCCAAHVLNLTAKQGLEMVDSSVEKLKGIIYLKPELD
ncbi:8618_t:CDS:2, partial [Cetraspora pellucida]